MAEVVSCLQRLAIQFGAVFWFALLVFGLLGLGVIYVLPWWILALVVVAGIVIGLFTYFELLLADKAIHQARHVTANATYGALKDEYVRLLRENPALARAISAPASQKSDDDDNTLALLSSVSRETQDQKRQVGILCRGFMAMSNAGVIGGKDTTLDPVILDFRNRALARFVAQYSFDKNLHHLRRGAFSGLLEGTAGARPSHKGQFSALGAPDVAPE